MESQVLYRKWRSRTLSELVGQQHVTQTLLNALKNDSISHAYLFCGPRGTGKTSTARILAKAVNCLTTGGRGEPCNTCDMCKAVAEDRAMDVIEIDAASNRGIDDIRELREKANYAPTQARRKVYIIDEFHMLSKDASNALHKTLEEPPPHVIFILATTESHKVLPTILSRCQHFDFHRLARADVVDRLAYVCEKENIRIEKQSLQLIARNATGSLRDAYNLLEQLTTFYGKDIQLGQLQQMLGMTGDRRVREIVQYISKNDLSGGMATLNNVNSDGLDLHQFNRELVEYLRNLLLAKTGAFEAIELAPEDIAELKELAGSTSLSQVLNAIKLFGQIQLGNQDTSTLPMELALVECYLQNEVRPGPVASRPETRADSGQRPAVPVKEPLSALKTVPPAVKAEPVMPKSQQVSGGTVPANAGNISTAAAQPGKTQQEVPLKADTGEQTARSGREGVPAAETVEEAGPEKSFAPAGTSASLNSEIERLKINWKSIIDNVPDNLRKSSAVAILRSAGIKPLSSENGIVTLSIKHAIFKERIEKPECQQVVEKILGDYLGHPCRVECVHKGDRVVNLAIKRGGQITSVEEK